jgi:hypothetical protein
MIEHEEGRYICPFGHRHESKDDMEECEQAVTEKEGEG